MNRAEVNEYFFCDAVSPLQIDGLWAKGWRHFGTYFFRYSSVQRAGEVYTVLPLRVRLTTFTPSRSQKRVLRRNRDLRASLVPAFVNDEANALFERHKVRFADNVPESLYTFVSQQPARVPCECLSLCLHEAESLVGVSYLDVGAKACSSVYQCFDPDLSKRSLGILMILLSLRYARAAGKRYYYPGYAYREPSHYDYKKTLGGLEGFEWAGEWRAVKR